MILLYNQFSKIASNSPFCDLFGNINYYFFHIFIIYRSYHFIILLYIRFRQFLKSMNLNFVNFRFYSLIILYSLRSVFNFQNKNKTTPLTLRYNYKPFKNPTGPDLTILGLNNMGLYLCIQTNL